MPTPPRPHAQPYVTPAEHEPLDAVQAALLRLLLDLFGDEICAELSAEYGASVREASGDGVPETSEAAATKGQHR